MPRPREPNYDRTVVTDMREFRLTAKIALDKRFEETKGMADLTAEAIQIILEEKLKRACRGLLLTLSEYKVEVIKE